VGKVMLAFGSDAGPAELTAFTPRTIVDPDALAAEVAAVRERGWATAVGEREPDLNALAAPVRGRGGELVAIVGLQGPAARLTEKRRREVLPALQATVTDLTQALGG
jgi:DNA-binding IclR family transcriptional regulator